MNNIGLREAILNFELKNRIGEEGRNSEVFIAHDKQFDADVVIKRIPKKDFNSEDEYYKEAKCLYASKHQNIVSVHYSCEDQDYIYMAMPYYRRGSLQSLIETRFLTVREIIKYALDFISGLNHIHTKGLIHFDIKPTNILISDSNEALVTDFGLSKFTDVNRTAKQRKFYTLHTAPECLKTETFTIQVDIYQVGLTLYRMCNDKDILEEQTSDIDNLDDLHQQISSGRFPNRDTFLPHIPKQLRKIIKKALSVNPEDRHNNLVEMLNELSKIDEILDWQMNANKEKWKLDTNDKIYDVRLIKKGELYDIEVYKTMKSSGKRTREIRNFKNCLTKKNVEKELSEIFKSY